MSKRILVVEDPAICWPVPTMNSPKRRTVRRRLSAIAEQRPDLILMDIQLPIMDGVS